MAGYNFFGPFFEAQIRNEDGEKLTLTPNGKKPNLPIADSMEVKVTGGDSGEIEISVTLKPNDRDLGFALMGDPSGKSLSSEYKDVSNFIKFGNILMVRFGYSSDKKHNSGWLAGFIITPEVNIGTTIEFTINAKSANWFAKRDYHPRYFGGNDDKLPDGISPLNVLYYFCEKHKWGGPFFYSNSKLSETPPEALQAMKKDKRKDLVQSNAVSDWEFIRWLCNKYGAIPQMRIKDSKYVLSIMSDLTNDEAAPIAKFIYGSQMFGGESNIFPILGNISTVNTLMFLSTKGNVNINKVDSLKKAIEDEANATTSEFGGTTVDGGWIGHGKSEKDKVDSETDIKTSSKGEEKGDGGSPPTTTRETAQEARIKAQAKLLKNSGLTIEFDTVGVPHIYNPNDIIQIEVGKTWLNGNYAVIEATHRIDSSGYTMHISAVAHGVLKSFWSKDILGELKSAKDQKEAKGGGNKTTKEAK